MKKSILKSILMSMLLCVPCFAFTSCDSESEPDPNNPDVRDNFVGTYYAILSGSYVMDYAGQVVNQHIADGGTIKITKDGKGNRIKMKTDFSSVGTVKGVIENDTLILDPETATQTENGIKIKLTSTYSPAQLIDNNLTIEADLSGSVYVRGYTGKIKGSQTLIATKK